VKRIVASLVFLLFMAAQPVAAAQPSGPLNALDGDLVTKVRLAGLWEMPAGEMAQDARVHEVGRILMTDHAVLDQEVRRVAALYNWPLPDEPNDAQKSWLTEMATSTGAQFDSVWAMRLRFAHGMIFPLIAQVRGSTTDPEIRKFATTANTIVMKHMTILESTNNVAYESLADPTPLKLASDSEGTDMVVAVALVPLMVALTIFVLWLATSRNRRRNKGARSGPLPDDESRSRLFVDKEYAR
jgi:predicted outer membrane protein